MRASRQNPVATANDLSSLTAQAAGAVEDTAEITGTTPNRKLWVNDSVTGERRLLVSTGDPNTPRFTRNRRIIFESSSGTQHISVNGGSPAPILTTKTVALNGDSITAGISASRIQTSLGVTVTNLGVAGQASSEIAIRQGGLQPLLTVTGNQIPASGAVNVTAMTPTTSYRAASSTSVPFTWVGTLAGIPGTLTHYSDQASNLWTFTRTASGTATTCPAGTPFICTQADPHVGTIQTIWPGRNNINIPGTSVGDVGRDIASMVAHLSAYSPQYLVIGISNATNETPGSTNYIQIKAHNAAMAAIYGKRFYDIWVDFINNGLTMAGITPTTADTAAIAGGTPPPSLMSDIIHPNVAGYNVLADLISNKITAMGWLAA